MFFLLFSFLSQLSLFGIFNVYFNLIMKFVLKPSLEHMALAKISISLWNQNDVSALIKKHSSGDLYSIAKWKTIEERVIDKVLELSLPQLLKEKVFGVIKPIGMQILEWIKYYALIEFKHNIELILPAHLPVELCWTPQGTVDRKRTAEVLVRDENLSVSKRYRLACEYFLEDDITRFWNRLPDHLKNCNSHNFPVVRFWSDKMKIGGAGHISYKRAFSSSVRDGNKVAAKYFLEKLTPQDREECLEELAIYVNDADVLCFLLPEMEEEEQKTVFKSNPDDVLEYFLQWPWQSSFIGVANCMWDFLSKDDYRKLLGDIIGKVKDGYKDYNYQKLFGEFFQKSPSALKDSFIEEIDKTWIVQYLFDIKDKENIRLILMDAKAKLIYSDEIKICCRRSIHHNEWDFLEFFIQECFPSKNEMLKFKEEFEKHRMSRSFKQNFATKKHIWDQLFSSSDVVICKSDKRNVEEGESSSFKRFRSLQ